jgi:SAM-dependent methyltransferase
VPVYEGLEALDGRRFGGIYTVNVLEHLEDDQALLDAFYRALEPGGMLFIYVPAFPLLFSANDERVGHYRRYRIGPLAEMLRRSGFSLERSSYVDSIGFFAGLAYRYLGNADGDLDVGAVRLYDRAVFPLSRVMDHVLGQLFGKNLLVHAVRPRRA